MKLYIKSNTETIKEKISKILEQGEYWYYGLRVDDYNYKIGDICYNSHQLLQDPDFDDDGNLIYPYCEDGKYEGLYDAGELDGTSAVGIFDEDIDHALSESRTYIGDHLYLLGGNYAEEGYDKDELVIRDAKVLLKIR